MAIAKALILFSQNHFSVDFEVCFQVIVLLEGCHLWPSLSFLVEATRFLAKICPGTLMELIMPLISNQEAPGPLAAKQPQSINDPPAIFDGRYELLSLVCIPLLTPNMLTVCMAKKFNFGLI